MRKSKDANPFSLISIEEAFKKVSSGRSGLSTSEAERRISEQGYNELPEKKQNYLVLFASKFFAPVPLLLWAVIILSYLLHHAAELYVVLALLVFNAVIGFAEEYRADRSIDALKERLSINARVLRDGAWKVLPSRELVAGDVIRVRSGDIVPADAKIFEADATESDESMLTGESMPVAKKAGDLLYTSATVKRGEATCLVIGTGANTYYGKTAKLVEEARPKSHLEAMIMHIVRYLVVIDLAVVASMYLYGTFAIKLSLGSILPFLLVVFIASVPVALPATFTVAMAYGTEKLAKKSILVTKLDAIEETSTMNVLCLDKTGTITKNIISVKGVYGASTSEGNVVRYAAEASRMEDNDPIDIAVLRYAKEHSIKPGRQVSYTPFDPSTKRSEAQISSGVGKYRVTKGAPQVIAELCGIGKSGSVPAAIEKVISNFSEKGYRTLAVAVKRRGAWKFSGIIGLYDEPRPDARRLIKELESLGIRPMMLTGDNSAVAAEIATEIGMHGSIIDEAVLSKGEKALAESAPNAAGFAGIYPEDKYKIVKALQGGRYSVGMTGDGVNDAPALKQAEVGIAVASATDVAKSSADLVLTESGIEVIVNAVKESRRIFERMITYTIVKIVKVMQILSFIAVVFFAFRFIPILPLQLIVLIFTNDIVNMAIATDNSNYSSKPDVWHIKPLLYSSAAIGIALMLEAFLLLPISFSILHLGIPEFQTEVFLMLAVTDKLTIYNVREKHAFWKSRPSTLLVISSAIGIAAAGLVAYYGIFMQGIGLLPMLIIAVLSVLFLFVVDAVKVYTFKRLGVR